MKWLIVIYGINSIFAQTLIIREISSSFYSNEIFISLSIAGWLFASIIGVYISKFFNRDAFIKAYHILSPYLILILLLIIKIIKIKTSPLSEDQDFFFSAFISFLSSLVFSSLNGIYYILVSDKSRDKYIKTYFFDSAGCLLGGILIYLFISAVKTEYIIIFLTCLNIFFLSKSLKNFRYILLLFLILPTILLTQKILKASYANKVLIDSSNSEFSRIDVYKNADNIFIYSNSELAYSDVKDMSLEAETHIPALFVSKIEKVGVIGSNLNIADELMKYTTSVYIIADDIKLYDYQKKYLKLSRYPFFLKPEKLYDENGFDLILISNKFPESIYSNKFYSFEFFRTLKETLKPDGVLSITLPYTNAIPKKELKKSINILLNTLSSVFKNVRAFYDEDIIILSSNSDIKASDNSKIIKNTKFLTTGYINYLLSREFHFESNAEINLLEKPSFFLNTTLYELSKFYPNLTSFLVDNMRYAGYLFYGLIIFLSIILRSKNKIFSSMFIASFISMSVEIISIFLFQINYGYIYRDVVVIVSLFMIGSACGIKVFQEGIIKKRMDKFIFLIPITLIFFKISFYLYFVNFIAALINSHTYALFIKHSDVEPQKIYITDIIGGLLATLILPVFFISVYGVKNSILMISILNLISIINS
jgi:predicted membrane-bound spermidine synthase